MLCRSYLPDLIILSLLRERVQVLKLLIVQFSRTYCHFIPLRCRCSQHPVLAKMKTSGWLQARASDKPCWIFSLWFLVVLHKLRFLQWLLAATTRVYVSLFQFSAGAGFSFHYRNQGARVSVVGWGTMLQAGKSRDQKSIRSLDISIDLILPAALWPRDRLSL
jgi:hypothetical protein